ncbi:MAG: valine--tRNA ligase [Alphaproteobacteria bacterium]
MLDKNFNPQEAEAKISQQWLDKKLFKCNPDSNKPAFSVIIPPPNVTGNLHIGHALNNSIQDCLCRYKRMAGFDVLWQPGTDHAGIATQMVVERNLAKEGISRHDLGREKFVEKIWEWKAHSGGQIINQLKRLGSSCDWDRERFTMDEGLSKAVLKVFTTLFKDGLIYKDKRLVNWDCQLQTAVSDLEVIQKETVGKMWYMKYMVENSDEFIIVATTRPETFFGDTAVAVNAEDPRYKHLIGKNVMLPIINKPIPVIADEHADPEKGTGAVKITPAHDFNDFEVGKRHNLPLINILTKEALLNENVPQKYQGLTPLEARPLVLQEIKDLGLYVKEEDNAMVIPYGDRSNVIIEPWLTDQWFVDAKKLAIPAIEAVKSGKTNFVPKQWENTYFEWMNNIQPWCISRQLWWGHQVPVWYGPDEHMFCEETKELAQKVANTHYGKEVELRRDTDVLDTWFSSGLWAFSTLGWPKETTELHKYYPTSALVTAFDIIFFWVARMMMMSMYFQKEVPFKDIYIHGLVRDEHGQKMSKSKGNGIDPLTIIDKFGADPLRFALLSQAGHGRDVLMGEKLVEENRNFVTKIWNSVRFCEMNNCVYDANFDLSSIKLDINKWMLTKLSDSAKKIGKNIEEYSFNDASKELYHFIWSNFCDWYLEAIKPIFYGDDEALKAETSKVAGFVVREMLKLISPFMPFVAQELWSQLGNNDNMIMQESWTSIEALENQATFNNVEWLFEFIGSIRALRQESKIPAGAKIKLCLSDIKNAEKSIIENNTNIIQFLARVENIEYVDTKIENCVASVMGDFSFMIPLEGLIDVEKERLRIAAEKEKINAVIAKLKVQLDNPNFVNNAPKAVVEKNQQALAEAMESLKKLEAI